MNKNTKRLLPILISLVLIASSVWYLFVYDRDFTRDSLLGSARFFDNRGEHGIASWLYDLAYLYSGSDETVAIELAEYFISNGNYTQAEITLSRAIAEGASARLYTALCQTYVAQGKLLDAVTMLESITDPEILSQINDQRPAAPLSDPAPGYYSQYVPVHITSENALLYVTTDGSYPSAETVSDGNVTLTAGENVIYALCVGENGLVSPLSIFVYTISGVIEPVTLSDSAIDAAVREQLNVGSEYSLLSSDLWNITELVLPEGAADYRDLQRFTYLQSLRICGGSASSLDGISALSGLTELTVENAIVTADDLRTIASLPKLQKLTLRNCSLSGVDALSSAEHLEYLDLSCNSIRDFTALSFMSGLRYLDLSHNGLTSLNAASGLSSLQTLNVSYNALTSVTPLAGCKQLQCLDISNNAIVSLTGLENLSNLTELYASFNTLNNLQPLSGRTSLNTLDVSSNQLTDISCISGLSGLQFLYFARNQVTTIPDWGKDCALITIDGSNNQITSIATLSGYANLNYVYMDYNSIVWVDGLASCPNMIKVSVFGNPVSDVSALTKQSIIVNYNPIS